MKPRGRNPASMPAHREIGARLRKARLLAGLTQAQVADGLGLTFQQVQKYERGKNRVDAVRLLQIANIFNCSIVPFFEGLEIYLPRQQPKGSQQ